MITIEVLTITKDLHLAIETIEVKSLAHFFQSEHTYIDQNKSMITWSHLEDSKNLLIDKNVAEFTLHALREIGILETDSEHGHQS